MHEHGDYSGMKKAQHPGMGGSKAATSKNAPKTEIESAAHAERHHKRMKARKKRR